LYTSNHHDNNTLPSANDFFCNSHQRKQNGHAITKANFEIFGSLSDRIGVGVESRKIVFQGGSSYLLLLAVGCIV